MTEILRDEFGFDGIVMADGVALDRLQEAVGDEPHAAALALSAGVDVACGIMFFHILKMLLRTDF